MPETPGLAESVYEVKGRDFLPAEVLTKPVCPAHIGPTMDLSAVAVPAVRLGGSSNLSQTCRLLVVELCDHKMWGHPETRCCKGRKGWRS